MELCTRQELHHFKLKLNQYLLSFSEDTRKHVIEDLATKANINTQTVSQYRYQRKPVPKARYKQILGIIEQHPFVDKYKDILSRRWS